MLQPERTLLIVDDSPEDRELYRRYLRRNSEGAYAILNASTGQQGLELWQQHRPDAVLLDYRLPDLDGLAFLDRLRSLTQQSCLPVVIVTGQGNEAIAVQAIKAGAQDYLVKGAITVEGLHLAVNGAIEAVQLRTQLQQRLNRERLIAQITRQIHQSLDLEQILQTTVTEVRQFLNTDRVLVFQLQPDGNGTVVAESVGDGWQSLLDSTIYDPCLAENYLQFSRPEFLNRDLDSAEDYVKRYRQGQVTAIPDIHSRDIDPCHVELLAQFQVNANLVVPILHDDQFWGLLIAHHCESPRFWQSLEIDLLKELATQLGIALRQAELYQQSQSELAERNRVEAELRASEERLRSALEASRMGTWDWNIATGQVQWSNGLEAMFGLAAGAFDGSFQMFSERLHPDDRDRVLAAVDQAIATGEHYKIEFRVVYPNGTVRWALSQGKVFYDQNGQPVRMAGNDIDITDRKQAETALQESESRFRQLAENIDVVFWMKEVTEGRVSYVSPAYERLWGLNSQEVYENHQAWIGYIHPADREAVDKAFQAKAAAGLFDEEYRIILPNGQVRWVHDRCFPLQNQSGEIYRFTGIAEDITDRKQIEEMLRLQAQVLDQTHDSVVSTDLDGNITSWNKGAERVFGYTAEEVLGRPVALLYPSDQHMFLRNQVLAPLEANGKHEVEVVNQRKSGERFDLLLSLSFLRNEHQKPIGMIGFSIDITDRKLAEDALRRSEAFNRRILESSSDCIKLFTLNGQLLYMNPGGLCMMEMDDIRPYLNVDWASLWQEDMRETIEAAISTAKAGELTRFQGFCPTAKGTPKWWDVVVTPILNPEGQVIQLLATSRDITDRKQSELERDRLLEQEQAARASAERANRIKDEFLAVLSHELRSPLNPILGWTKLMQSRKFDVTKTQEALATIERNAKLQTQLIDDLLDVAKILRGKLSMNATPVDLAFVIEQAIDTVRTAAVAKNITLHAVLPQIGRVSGDAARLQQIVWNLLSNAIKFTPTQRQVDIRLERIGNQAQIMVSDTGKGINPDFLPHIFESFRQEDASTTRKYGGLGLGLAIVRHLVEAHGGTIWADSPGEGQGATFAVQLPLLDTEPEKVLPQAASVDELNLAGIRVMSVDDDPDARDLLASLLEQYGAEVLVVTSAAEVLANLASFRPDVLVSDIGMPEMDGYTLIQHVRTLSPEQGGQIPAIALTAYAREGDYQQAINSGYQRHITKPLDPEELVRAVKTLMHQNRVDRTE